ncbi:hypothetical protein BC826DRAFT_967166 [Russula brevipes]|nr:hypothetical protein BC826DRAFT_967166 [Russula brevipes]
MIIEHENSKGVRKENTGLEEYAAPDSGHAAGPPAYSLARAGEPSTSSSVVVASPSGNMLPIAASPPGVPTNGVSIFTVIEPINGSWLLDPLAAQTSTPSILQTLVENRAGRRPRRSRNMTMGTPTAKLDSRHGNISAAFRVVGESAVPAIATIRSSTRSGKSFWNLSPSLPRGWSILTHILGRVSNISLLIPRSFSGLVELRARNGDIELLPALAATGHIVKATSKETVVLVGNGALPQAGFTSTGDLARLCARSGRVRLGISGEDAFTEKTHYQIGKTLIDSLITFASADRSGSWAKDRWLLAGSRRQRGCQTEHILPQGESAPLAPQPDYVRIASSCDFGSAQRDGGLPPPYSWTTAEKDHIPDALRTIEDTLRELDPELRRLSLDIHGHPELNFEERYAHDRLTEFMSSRGFTVTRHYLGLDTAWCAEFKRGLLGRVIGVNAEMDALPGIGHGCGHNLIAMAGVGIALALRAAMEKHNISGTVILLGTPAEETGAGKQILLERGAYNDMDICIMCHPVSGDTLELGFVSSLALQSLSVEYFGQPAHAGYAPWDGVNALDAAFVAYAGISALRQQIRPEQRVHGIISGRDWTPNVIPDYAKMSWSVRADAWGAVEPLRERVVRCLESGASATGCRHEVHLGERYLDLHQNPVLAEDLALTAQRCYGISSYWAEQPASASTDFGNISYALPALHPIFSIPTPGGAKNHTAEFARGARTETAHANALRTAALLARTGFRVLADGAFCRRVRAAYETGVAAGAGSAGHSRVDDAAVMT